MFSLALATLRTRIGGFLGAFVALFFAAALVSGCGLLLQTGLRSQVSSQRYAAAPLLVAADQQLHFVEHKNGKTKTKSKPATETARLSPTEAARIREIGGHASLVQEVSFPATVLGHPGPEMSLGHGWGSAPLTPFTLRAGHPPAGPGQVVADAGTGARVGDRVRIQTPQSIAAYTVVGVTRQALPGERAVFFSDRVASMLAGDRISAIGIWPAPGVDRAALIGELGRAGHHVAVYTGIGKGQVEFGDASRSRVALISMSAVIGATALLVAILVVVGTIALSIEQRHREIALLRAVGGTPRQVRRMLGREMLVVGVLAAGLGGVAGLPLGRWLHGRFVAYGAIPQRLPLDTGPLPVIAAALVTLAAGWLAARIAARRPTRSSAAAALAGADLRRVSMVPSVAGLALLAAGIGGMALLARLHTMPAAMPVSLLAVVACAAGLMLLAPVVGGVAGAVTAVPLRLLSPAAGWLAAENLRANARRLAAVVGPITLAVAIATAILFTGSTVAGAAHRQALRGITANYALTSAGPGVPADVVTAARAVPGVTAITPVLHSTVWIGRHRYSAQGVAPAGAGATMDLDVAAGSIDRLAAHTVALSTTTAAGLDEHVGDTLALRLGDGTPARLRVVATYRRGLGFGDLTLPHDLLAAHVDDPAATTVLIAARPDAAPALHQVAAGYPGVRLSDRATVGNQRAPDGNAAVRYIALGLIVAFTAISVVNTLVIATLDRRRECELLRRVGATRRQILRMLHAEALAALITGLVLGAAIGTATLIGFAVGITGSAIPTVTIASAVAIVVAAALLTYLAVAVPARAVVRTPRPRR